MKFIINLIKELLFAPSLHTQLNSRTPANCRRGTFSTHWRTWASRQRSARCFLGSPPSQCRRATPSASAEPPRARPLSPLVRLLALGRDSAAGARRAPIYYYSQGSRRSRVYRGPPLLILAAHCPAVPTYLGGVCLPAGLARPPRDARRRHAHTHPPPCNEGTGRGGFSSF